SPGPRPAVGFGVRYFLSQDLRRRVDSIAVKGGTKVPDILKFEIGNSFTAHISNGHTKRNTKNKWTRHKRLLKFRVLRIVGIDVERIMIHGEHTEEHVVGFGDCTTRPVFIQGTDLELFVTAAKLHICLSFFYAPTIYISPTVAWR